jgi:Glucose inhibited division protein A
MTPLVLVRAPESRTQFSAAVRFPMRRLSQDFTFLLRRLSHDSVRANRFYILKKNGWEDDSMSAHYQVIVIGPGSGGKEAAILTARAGLQVLLVGKERLGGTMEQPKEFPLRVLGRSFGKKVWTD